MVLTGPRQATCIMMLQAEPKKFVSLNSVRETTSRRNVSETCLEVRFEQDKIAKSFGSKSNVWGEWCLL